MYGGTPPPPPPGAPGYGPAPQPSGGSSGNRALILLMVALVAVVLMVVAGLLVLRSQDGGDDEVVLSREQLEAALLTVDDLDGAFTQEEASDAPEEELDVSEIDASEECSELWSRLDAEGAVYVAQNPTNGVEGAYLDADRGIAVDEELSSGSSAGLSDVRELFGTCGSFALDLDDVDATVTFEVVDDVVEVGDDRITVKTVVDYDAPEDYTYRDLTVVWTRAGNDAYVTVSEYDVDADQFVQPDDELLTGILEAADANLEDAIDQAA